MKAVIIICIVFFPCLMMGQTTVSQRRPMWLSTTFSSEQYHNSYFYQAKDTGSTKEAARNKAVERIIQERYMITGKTVKIQSDGRIVVLDSELTIKACLLDEYIERTLAGDVSATVLVQVAKHPDSILDPVRVSEDYPFSPRVFLPGMEQFYKGSFLKGGLFIAGEAVSVIGIVVFENLRVTEKSRFMRTHDLVARQRCLENADRMRNLRNGFIAGAVAVYLWNIIDGCVAKGGRRFWVKKLDVNVAINAVKQESEITFGLKF